MHEHFISTHSTTERTNGHRIFWLTHKQTAKLLHTYKRTRVSSLGVSISRLTNANTEWRRILSSTDPEIHFVDTFALTCLQKIQKHNGTHSRTQTHIRSHQCSAIIFSLALILFISRSFYLVPALLARLFVRQTDGRADWLTAWLNDLLQTNKNNQPY